MTDSSMRHDIAALVEREHRLREQLQTAHDPEERAIEREQLRRVEEELDQCWDLLRQRQARRDSGQNPDEATARPVSQVEGYLQ
jgi:hypothetical protein